jgi:hypothetical protein
VHFGIKDEVARDALANIIESVPKLGSIHAQMLLLDRYETTYQIYNHEDAGAHPFGAILMHWNQDTITEGGLHERMREFAALEVGKTFNISFPDFLDQPTYVCELMLKTVRDKIRKDAPELEAAIKALQGAKNK